MSFEETEAWIEEHSTKWMALPAPPKLSLDEFFEATAGARR